MGQQTESFWTDIKRYEDTLAKDPASYCFAPLSELYRKVGLLDDAIGIARKGIEIHPEYVGGYMALGRACFEKGLIGESRAALERVVRVTPDNLMAQKLLSQIYVDAGETDLARRALEIILSLNHDDLESKVALEALSRSAERSYQPEPGIFPESSTSGETDLIAQEEISLEEEEMFEEVEIIEELSEEVIDEEDLFLGPSEEAAEIIAAAVDEVAPESDMDPLSTVTIAELYVSQGFLKKALKIYRDLLEADPDNDGLRTRLIDLKTRIDEDEARARENALEEETSFEEVAVSAVPEPEEGAVSVLEGWLENIRRIRECRSGRH